jgi:adhesin transport system outer membrane protein
VTLILIFYKGIMKYLSLRTDPFGRVPKIILPLLAMAYCTPASATPFLDILRMTAAHPSIASAQDMAGAALFDVDAEKASNNLQVSAGIGAVGYSGQPGYENNYLSPHINISKVLYDHGRNAAAVEGREAEYEAQRAQIKVARESLNQQVLSLYTTAVTNARVVSVLDREIAALGDLLKRVQTIATIDSGRASEVSQVSTRLSAVVASREASYTAQQQAWQQLTQIVNKPITLTNGLPDLKKAALLPASLTVAQSALMDNPSFVVTRYRRDSANSALKVASKWTRPKWSVQLSLDSPRHNGRTEPFKAATLQLSSDASLWDGGAGMASVKGQTRRLASAEQEMEATFRTLKSQLSQLWISLPLRERQIMALSRQSASALKTWRAGETQFFAGQRPLTDLISFATDYYSSLASYEEQRVQYIATQWQIVGALGKLSDLTEKVQSLPAPAITQINAAEHNSVAPSTFTSRANNAVSPADELAPEAFVTTSASH